MDNCKHIGQIRSSLKTLLFNPSKWLCAECATTDSLWICLTCSHMACGRFTSEHALAHYNETKHCICLEMNEGYAYCYACDDYILNDTVEGAIRNYRDMLSVVRTQSISSTANRRRSGRRTSTSEVRKDLMVNTVVTCRRMIRLSRAFTSWRDLVQTKRNPPTYHTNDAEQTLTHSNSRAANLIDAAPSTSKSTSDVQRIPPGVTGLRNLGNTCYMNSVLQVLSNLSEFREYFLAYCPIKPMLDEGEEHAPHKSTSPISLSDEVRALFNVMWSGKMSLVIPQGFLEAVWRRVPGFKGFEQQDAQEFLAELLQQLCEEQSVLEEEQTGRRGKRKATTNEHMTSKLGRLFNGETRSIVTCQRCGTKTHRLEAFTDLSLQFPQHFQECKLTSINYALDSCHVTEMLSAFTMSEDLGEVYACDKCNHATEKSEEEGAMGWGRGRGRGKTTTSSVTFTEAHKQISVTHLPKILRLHLKRFRWMNGGSNRDKISIHVQFNEVIDMRPFCVADGNARLTNTRYRLCGVIIHHGRGFNCGHYTSYCYHQVGQFWMHCNDARLKCTTLEEVLGEQAYILFYSRIEDNEGEEGETKRSRPTTGDSATEV